MIEIKRKPQKPPVDPQKPVGASLTDLAKESKPEPQSALKRQLEPFTAIDGVNYRAIYRDVCNFHSKYIPPQLDRQDGGSVDYWQEEAREQQAIFERYNLNPFVMDLLIAVYEELERQYNIILEGEKKHEQR